MDRPLYLCMLSCLVAGCASSPPSMNDRDFWEKHYPHGDMQHALSTNGDGTRNGPPAPTWPAEAPPDKK